EEDQALREKHREAWRVGLRHFERAEKDAVFMDCMPLIRGDEADAEVVDGPMSIRYDEAENRLHAQKAILASILSRRWEALLCPAWWSPIRWRPRVSTCSAGPGARCSTRRPRIAPACVPRSVMPTLWWYA